MEGEEVSITELTSNLSTYKEQLQQFILSGDCDSAPDLAFPLEFSDRIYTLWSQVRQLLSEDPRNSEYADMENELKEVIALTEELLTTAKQNEISLSDAGVSDGATAGYPIY